MHKLSFVIAACLLATGGAALAKKDKLRVPEARITGEAVSCVPLHQIRESRVRSDQVIDFRVSGKKWYRNTLPAHCPSLGFEERFMYKTSMNQLCSVDFITVLQSYGSGVGRGASCGLGKFQPIELVSAK